MPVIDQVGSSNESTVGIYISMQTQEERLTNDLRDIMREANTGVELRFRPRIGLDEAQDRIGRKSSG